MAGIISKRVTAKIEGDFVVFLIGMRINRFWKPWKWLRARPPTGSTSDRSGLRRANAR